MKYFHLVFNSEIIDMKYTGITEAQIEYLEVLGISREVSEKWDKEEASYEIDRLKKLDPPTPEQIKVLIMYGGYPESQVLKMSKAECSFLIREYKEQKEYGGKKHYWDYITSQ